MDLQQAASAWSLAVSGQFLVDHPLVHHLLPTPFCSAWYPLNGLKLDHYPLQVLKVVAVLISAAAHDERPIHHCFHYHVRVCCHWSPPTGFCGPYLSLSFVR